MALEKNHDFSDIFLVFPCPSYHAHAFTADSPNLLKFLDTIIDNFKRLFSKFLHYSRGHYRPYPLYETGSKIPSNAFKGGGGNGAIACHLELSPKLGVVHPGTLHL